MLRIFGKTTLLAVALVAATSLVLPTARHLSAQELESCPDSGMGSRSAAGVCPGCAKCGLHHNQTVNCRPQQYGQPELFHNYYVPGTCGGVPAAMYLAPQPVPALVGHTYVTYQPLMPHELLYQHHRTYYRYYDGGRGLTRTHVSWSRPPLTGWTSTLRIAR